MSSIYNTEPQPTASVILHTTHGDLSVELFAKQTPLTCRNFLQHCLDGYYDGTIFHRLVPGFILQGGDPTGTGNGGESIYDRGAFSGDLDPWPMDQRRGKNAGPTGVNFKDEFHSRLKFNRRGLLGMANESLPDTNGSQFFFTLDRAAELDGKNTMFGRVAGDTIYNLAKMGEAEVDEASERPLYPTKIRGVEVLVNPFEDMKKRERIAQRTTRPAVAAKKRDKKRKGGKQLLSFGDEEGEGDIEPLPKKPKFDTRIVMIDDEDENKEPMPPPPRTKAARKEEAKDERTVPIRETAARQATSREPSPPPPPKSTRKSLEKVKVKNEIELSPEPESPKKKTELERTNEEIAALKASLKKTVHSSEPFQEEKKKSALEQMIPASATRGRKRKPGGSNITAAEERKALNFLNSFKAKLDQAPPEKAAEDASNTEIGKDKDAEGATEEDEVCDLHFVANCQSCQAWDKAEAKDDSDDEGWMSHSLSFAADKLGKDLTYRKKAEEELVVIDPLAKARDINTERKGKDGRGGSSRRAWDDIAKNAQMARASSLAGRGAK
ncbi:cyclophilin-like protein [Cryphonectria parasitica EP155]|uniref:peptidylprolyl isomerase n=1 Tax=Cryphonectria parasitica (strain ATCC 38755 / EP155) TaxID=660469 RepID=A0A9P5CPY8_CRYP1|nr:cyclophilin-like protein [Cryphonectria parasitica EP155]KAF3765470.1 cyclophilin-like protein [Cryphonectria parasitica EP155]